MKTVILISICSFLIFGCSESPKSIDKRIFARYVLHFEDLTDLLYERLNELKKMDDENALEKNIKTETEAIKVEIEKTKITLSKLEPVGENTEDYLPYVDEILNALTDFCNAYNDHSASLALEASELPNRYEVYKIIRKVAYNADNAKINLFNAGNAYIIHNEKAIEKK